MDKGRMEIVSKKLREANEEASLNPNKSMQLCNEALAISLELNNSESVGDCYIEMAIVARTKSEKSDILDYSFKALREYEKTESKEGISKAFNLIGVAYFYSGMYEEAIRYFLDGLNQLKGIDSPNLHGSLLNNIGEVYRESALYEKAQEYYKKAYEIAKE